MSLIEGLGVAAGALIALGVVWQKGILPLFRALRTFTHAIRVTAKAGPVLLSIADQFERNGGNSLRDRIEDINRKADIAAEAATDAKEAAGIAKLVAETNAKIVDEMTLTSVNDLRDIEAYIHEQAHTTRGQLDVQAAFLEHLSKQVEKVGDKLEKDIEPYVIRRRAEDR